MGAHHWTQRAGCSGCTTGFGGVVLSCCTASAHALGLRRALAVLSLCASSAPTSRPRFLAQEPFEAGALYALSLPSPPIARAALAARSRCSRALCLVRALPRARSLCSRSRSRAAQTARVGNSPRCTRVYHTLRNLCNLSLSPLSLSLSFHILRASDLARPV